VKKPTKKKMNSTIENLALEDLIVDNNARFIRNEVVERLLKDIPRQDITAQHPLVVHARPNPAGDGEVYDLLNGHHRRTAALQLGMTNWPCVVYRNLTELQKSILKMNHEAASPSSDPEKILLLHHAIMDFTTTRCSTDGNAWLDKTFMLSVKNEGIVDALIPQASVAEGGRATSNWQNSWVNMAAFGFRKKIPDLGTGRAAKPKKPASSTRCFTPPSILTGLMEYHLSELEIFNETITELDIKRRVSRQFINLFTQKSSSALTGNKLPMHGIMLNLEKNIMHARRLGSIIKIFRDLGLFVTFLLEEDLNEEQREDCDADIKRYLNVMKHMAKTDEKLLAAMLEQPVTQNTAILTQVTNLLTWAPVDFWSHFFGPHAEDDCVIWNTPPPLSENANLFRFKFDSANGSVQAPSNRDIRNRVKARMLGDLVNYDEVVEMVLEYLTYILGSTARPLVEDLLDFEYICYSKDYNGLGNFTHAGFYDEVQRMTLNETTPHQFGFIKSYSNLNWYNFFILTKGLNLSPRFHQALLKLI
jgi:hypothetical protein